MDDGFAKLWRKIVDSEVWLDPHTLKLFIWCVVMAKWKDTGDLKRGQFETGRVQGSQQTQMSPSKWYRGIQRLVDLGCITVEVNSNRTRITVCKYSTYNPAQVESEQQVNSKWTASEQPTLLYEEGKKERKEEAAAENSQNFEPTVAQNAAKDGPHSPEWLARKWVDRRRGTKGRDELIRATETFQEMLRHGVPGALIHDAIDDKGRQFTEPIWTFENRILAEWRGKNHAKHIDPEAGFRAVAEAARAREEGP